MQILFWSVYIVSIKSRLFVCLLVCLTISFETYMSTLRVFGGAVESAPSNYIHCLLHFSPISITAASLDFLVVMVTHIHSRDMPTQVCLSHESIASASKLSTSKHNNNYAHPLKLYKEPRPTKNSYSTAKARTRSYTCQVHAFSILNIDNCIPITTHKTFIYVMQERILVTRINKVMFRRA